MKTQLLMLFSLLFVCHIYAQPQLEKADAKANCQMIRESAFLNREPNGRHTKGYRIVFSGDYSIEYLDGGKYYVKSKIEYINDCEYTSTVVEVTKPNFHIKIGDTFRTRILETSTETGLIKIQVSINGTENFIILDREVK